MEERKFVCKYCNKRFPCGKSLGGHIRTHMSSDHHHSSAHANNNNNDERRRNNNVASSGGVIKFDAVRKRKREFLGSEDDVDGSGNSLIYGLRENPKKTMRFVHSNAPLQLDKFCKECGKGFPSLKALCGHMASHSEKEKPTNNNRFDNYNYDSNNNNSSGISEKQKLVMDSQSDTETSAPRRSKRMMRFKTITNSKNKSSSSAAANAATLGNGSSSVSEVEQEQEEVARCLMMLSKDNSYHYKARFALFTESSDNNSVVLEAKSKSKSPSVDTKFASAAAAAAISNGKVKDYVSNGYGVVDKKMNKYKHRDMKKLKYDEVDYDSDNSDSGYFRYGPKKVDSDDSSEEVKPSRKKDFGDFDGESRKIILSREGGRSRNTVFKKLVLGDSSASRKQNYNDSFGISSKKNSKNLNGFGNDKVLKYEFLTSERENNKNNNGSDYDSTYESDENSTDTESYPAPKAQSNSKNLKSGKAKKKKPKLKLKKSKEHECPICNKIFRSGQALGGHKRSHFVGGSEENTLVIRTSAPNHNHNHNHNHNPNPVVLPCLIDLNLPAPVDE